VTGWTTPEDLSARVRRRWDDGTLLQAYLDGADCPAVPVPIRGPDPGEIGADLARVQAWRNGWIGASRDGTAFALTMRSVGGRVIGRNELPARAQVTTFDQIWRLLGVQRQIAEFDVLVAMTRDRQPQLIGWLSHHAKRALAVAPDWPLILAALGWLVEAGGRARYLRQVDVVGVDTKFIARHRGLLAELLDVVLSADRIDQKHSRTDGFAPRYGFLAPPRLLRLRCDQGFAGLPGTVTEVAWRLPELATLRVAVQHVLVVENEVTYLSLPVPAEGVVIWGEGFRAGRLGRLPWLRAAPQVTYSGDLDSHGFAILNLLRSVVPQTRSLLMDRETLLAHRDRWGRDERPTRARLDLLTDREQLLYQELVEDVHGESVRLEQERLAWPWVAEAVEEAFGR